MREYYCTIIKKCIPYDETDYYAYVCDYYKKRIYLITYCYEVTPEDYRKQIEAEQRGKKIPPSLDKSGKLLRWERRIYDNGQEGIVGILEDDSNYSLGEVEIKDNDGKVIKTVRKRRRTPKR